MTIKALSKADLDVHKHFLKEVECAVEMTDIIHYRVPFGSLGVLLNTIIIKNRLKAIFDYRFKKIEEIFNRTINTSGFTIKS